MRKQQSGFTLIELVVVIVILGILAATAVPRFVDLSTDADTAACEGAIGALLSSTVLQVANNNGTAVTRATVISNTTLSGATASASATTGEIDVTTDGGTTCTTIDLNAAGLTSD